MLVSAVLTRMGTNPSLDHEFFGLCASKGFMGSIDVNIHTIDVLFADLDCIQVDLQDVEFEYFTSFELRIGLWFAMAPNEDAVDIFRLAPNVNVQAVKGTVPISAAT
jgi:hypothetical protein